MRGGQSDPRIAGDQVTIARTSMARRTRRPPERGHVEQFRLRPLIAGITRGSSAMPQMGQFPALIADDLPGASADVLRASGCGSGLDRLQCHATLGT